MATSRNQPDDRLLDWRGSWGGGGQQPCRHCGRLTFLRHPITRAWTHKVCDEQQFPESDPQKPSEY